MVLLAIHEYSGFNNSIASAPAPKRYGNSLTFETAISFLTGRKIYHEDRTKKNKKPPLNASKVKEVLKLRKRFLKKNIKILCPKNGGSHRIRTCDQLVKSQLLYQLS